MPYRGNYFQSPINSLCIIKLNPMFSTSQWKVNRSPCIFVFPQFCVINKFYKYLPTFVPYLLMNLVVQTQKQNFRSGSLFHFLVRTILIADDNSWNMQKHSTSAVFHFQLLPKAPNEALFYKNQTCIPAHNYKKKSVLAHPFTISY